ncbi:MAG: ACT domain-containing protein, partial [Anaerolineae bacterium]
MLSLQTLPGNFAIYRFAPQASVPAQVWHSPLLSVTRTPDELSVVCAADVPVEGALSCEMDWAALQVAGPLDFSLTGVLAGLSTALAAAGISVFAVST